MDHATRAKFLLAVHKHTLQAFDAGGTVLPGPGGSGVTSNPGGLAGGVGGILGLNPNAAQIQPGTNTGQLNAAYTGAQSGLNQTQGLVDTLSGQGTQGAAEQTGLAGQLENEAAGHGPNPAQAALNQSTGANVANTAALMAGQRGASANPALLAREAAQQGAATQQQAVGQGATLQAQQQLAAQGQLQNLAGTQVGQAAGAVGQLNQAQQNEQSILQNANTSANNAAVQMQGNINNNNTTTGNNLVGGITSGISSALPVLAGLLAKGGEVRKMASGGDVDANTPTAADKIAQAFGFPNAGPKPAPKPAPKPQAMASGGDVDANAIPYPSGMFAPGGNVAVGPQSFAGQWLNTTPVSTSGPSVEAAPTQVRSLGGSASGKTTSKDAPKIPSTAGPGALTLPTMGAQFSKGGKVAPKLASKGGGVKSQNPSQKATKKDNSYDNDKVPAMLSEGEIVLPRSVTMHPMAPQKAAEFVHAVLNKRKMGVRA